MTEIGTKVKYILIFSQFAVLLASVGGAGMVTF